MNCRQVTRLISDSKERKLTLKEKIGVKTHLIICPYCRQFKHHCEHISKLMKDFATKDGEY
ncbi:Uncharacterised protein [Mannheimia haemolytica]|uniref:Zf-HC2 domain-containing protein n=1 Tax=Mannheimia haemolytica TaxID=75985 RepID=A0A1D2Q562_MANHA|nr:zf-HC2 domain-containing protein [Mannheimia haemolytica]ODQ35949.1 dsDNA-mimic protein [Mannheimia haemolytica]UQX67278.1 zf-HC2 domain-containing protein [Mannheimia haemolytica]STY62473.1 Uncharacterised protein [Mannheimia haemolytica]VEI76660.1 Uncharacterised protein [Mannheimia haemolytica]HDV7284153.1 zf-HC2 domain-containing protein [Mannheimia haemolytica]